MPPILHARYDHRVVSRVVVVSTGVSTDGRRELLDLDVGDTEDEIFWTQFLRRLRSRGLTGVQLVISDAHTGNVLRIAVFNRQRCHLDPEGPFHEQRLGAQRDPEAVRTQLRLVADSSDDRNPAVTDLLLEAEANVTADATFPHSHWRRNLVDQPIGTADARNQGTGYLGEESTALIDANRHNDPTKEVNQLPAAGTRRQR